MLRKFFVFLLLTLLLQACDDTPEQRALSNVADVFLTTGTSVEAQRGTAVTALPRVLRGRTRSRFTDVERYLQGIVDRVALANDLDDYNWEVYLLRERSPNASTVGGGIIFVNEGMLLQTPNEADIAIILAHEMAHTTNADVSVGQRTTAVIEAVSTLATELAKLRGMGGNKNVSKGIELGTGLAKGQSSQGREARADRTGFAYYVRAGYRPSSAASVFSRLDRIKGNSSAFGRVFESHPSPGKRASALFSLAGQMPNREKGRVTTSNWNSLAAKVRSAYKPRN